MQPKESPVNFIVPLVREAHELAEQFSLQQVNLQKAKQLYLNTLAVYAVRYYLECMKIETNWEASDSWDLVTQTLMDTADLVVAEVGKLECRPVLAEAQSVYVPMEVWTERIGYVAVQLNHSLTQASLLGFAKSVLLEEELPLGQLQPFEDLLVQLHSIRQAQLSRMQHQTIKLSQWLENTFEAGWQSFEALYSSGRGIPAMSFRSNLLPLQEVRRAKLINLGLRLGSQSVALMVAITRGVEHKMNIHVRLHPLPGEVYLPPNIKIILLLESEEILQEVQSRQQDNYIQLLNFRGLPGDRFRIQVALDEVIVTEAFEI